MEKAAILHDMNQEYCFVDAAGDYVFRIRTKKDDALKVNFYYRDKYLNMGKGGKISHKEMEKVACDGITDYYETKLSLDMICLRYFFELVDEAGEKVYLGQFKFHNKKPADNSQMFDCPVKAKEEDRFFVPKWAKGKVVYQIFPDRFAHSGKADEKLWKEAPIRGFKPKFGGTLRGIIDKLDYLKDLGVDILYMTPIFLSDSNHRYDTIDYYSIDPEFGTKEELRELVDKAHALSMYVILDGVFNHTSQKFFAFKDLVEKEEQSEYMDWYFPQSFPLKTGFMQKPNFLSFGYFGGMPKLNTGNPKVQEYIFDVAAYWIREYGIDGWRLDVGDEVSHGFWKKFREAVKAVKEDALLIGEHWLMAPAFLQGDEWDTLMNYHFRDSLLGFVADGSMTATEFAGRMGYLRGRVHSEVYDVLWNLIGCHDTPRFLHLAKENKKKLMLAAGLLILSHGCPMLYYGDEVGMTGGGDPDCRRGMLWNDEEQDKDILSYYKKLLSLRKSEVCITEGIQNFLLTDDPKGLVIEERILKVDKKTGKNSGKCATTSEKIILIYQNGKTAIEVSEYAGWYDILHEKVFDGKVPGYGLVVLKRN